MRVIAGEARRLPLTAPSGKDTRPTTDRIKDTLFNIIQDDIPGCTFLDLFSGSGGIGIEAISRGAREAVFVEMSRDALKCIEHNIKKTHFEKKSKVMPMEVTYALSKLGKQGKTFDVIYADPPYRKEFEPKILRVLEESGVLQSDTLIILETDIQTEVDYVDESVYEIVRIKDYKTNRHIFLRRCAF